MAIKSVEKECGGLERFVPTSLTESMKKKVGKYLCPDWSELFLAGAEEVVDSLPQAELQPGVLRSEVPHWASGQASLPQDYQ